MLALDVPTRAMHVRELTRELTEENKAKAEALGPLAALLR